LTTGRNVVIIDNVKAKLLIHERRVLSDSELVEMKIWQVPVSVDPSRHNYKYSLVYISHGARVVGLITSGERVITFTWMAMNTLMDLKESIGWWKILSRRSKSGGHNETDIDYYN
jgi:hypothetical protein